MKEDHANTHTHPHIQGTCSDSDDTASPSPKVRAHPRAISTRKLTSDSCTRTTRDVTRTESEYQPKPKTRGRSLAVPPQVSSLSDDHKKKTKLLTETQGKNNTENRKKDTSSIQVGKYDSLTLICTLYSFTE